MLLCRIIRKNPPGLVELVSSSAGFEGSWAHTVGSNLNWCCYHPKFEHCAGFSFNDWVSHIRDSRPWSSFPRSIRMFLKSPFANISVVWKDDLIVAPCLVHLSCDACALQFQSQQSLALHKFKAHGVKNIARRLVDGVHCPVCLKLFWTRERVINHVRYRSGVCLANLLIRGPCLSVSEAEELDCLEHGAHVAKSKAGQRSHHAAIPAVQLQGPLLSLLVLPGTESAHHPLGKGHNHW